MTKTKYYLLLLLLCFTGGLTPLATDLYLPALPNIAIDMNVSVQKIQMTVSIFFAGFALGQLFYGPLSDAFGRKKIIILGISIFFLASLGCYFTNSFEYFFVMRLFQALGGAAAVVVINAMMRDLFDGIQFAKALSFLLLVNNVAPLVAPTLGGIIMQFGWRTIFALLCILSLVIILCLSFGLKESLPIERRQPFHLGVILNNYLTIFKNKKAFGAILAQNFHIAGMFAFISGSPYVYITYFGVDPKFYGILFSLNILMVIIITSFSGIIIRRLGVLRTLRYALLWELASAAIGVISAIINFSNVFTIVCPVMCYVGVIGIIGATSTTYSMKYFKKQAGTASAVIGSLSFGLGALAGMLLNSYQATNAIPMCLCIFMCGVCANSSFYGFRYLAINSVKKIKTRNKI